MNAFKQGSRAIRYGAVGLLVVVALAAVVIYAVGGLARLTADWRGEGEQIEKTEADGDFRVSTYEDFWALCIAAQDAEYQITSLKAELETDPDADRVQTIQTSLTAIRSNRADAINEYNALAAQEHTEAFRDAGLPAQLDTDTEETQCSTGS